MTRSALFAVAASLLLGTLAPAAAAPVDPMALVQPIADYKLYVIGEVGQLVADTRKFVDAIKAGRLDEAKALYAPARVHYERIEPVAELFDDLDKSIDSRADDHEHREDDPGFIGFHRLEYALFAKHSTDGVDAIADKLMADVEDLQARVHALTIPPEKMVGGAAALIEEVAATKISGEEDRYSRTDLWDFAANIEGARKIVELLHPLTRTANKALDDIIGKNLDDVDKVLAKYKLPGGGFEPYDKVSDRDRTLLRRPITTLAEDLSKLRGTLGLD
jgi:iron uptake system component EfeO